MCVCELHFVPKTFDSMPYCTSDSLQGVSMEAYDVGIGASE
jgi:hypothetical protein